MDRGNEFAFRADKLHGALELSKKSGLLAIQFLGKARERTRRSIWPLVCSSSRRSSLQITLWRTRRLSAISR